MPMWGLDGSSWWVMTLWMLLFWGGFIAAIFLVVRMLRRPNQVDGQRTAREILAERFARGEIDSEEFDRRRQLLDAAAGAAERKRRR